MKRFETSIPKGNEDHDWRAEEWKRILEDSIVECRHLFLRNTSEVLRTMQSSIEKFDLAEPLKELSDYHRESFGHSMRMTALGLDIAIENELPNTEGFSVGGLLHDIGKLDIPLEILDKRTSFGAEDRLIIEKHVLCGLQRLSSDERLRRAASVPLVKEIVGGHHLLKKENPYPDVASMRAYGINPETWSSETLNAVSVAAVTDVYDAIAIGRKFNNDYREPKTEPRVVFPVIANTEDVPENLIASALERYSGNQIAA